MEESDSSFIFITPSSYIYCDRLEIGEIYRDISINQNRIGNRFKLNGYFETHWYENRILGVNEKLIVFELIMTVCGDSLQ